MHREHQMSLLRETTFPGTVRAVFLGWSLVSRATVGVSFTTSYSSSLSDSPSHSDCNGTIDFIEDGYCDASNNNEACDYDGGDCCVCSCVSTQYITCGFGGFDCLDNAVGDLIFNCDVLSVEPPEVSPCVPGARSQWVVETTADADLLAESMLCSGGMFEVKWKGDVSVKKTLYAIDGTVLDVAGASNAVADGGGTTQIFSMFGGVLRVSNLQMNNGAGVQGGAIYAARQSEVALTGVSFGSNTANYSGGAIHVENATLELIGGSTFTGNSAIRGGAVSVGSSSFMQHAGNGEQNQFIDNSATYGGALYVYGISELVCDTPTHSTSTVDSSYSEAPKSTSSSSSGGSGSGRKLDTDASYYTADSSSTFDAAFAKTTFTNNTAEKSGGAVHVNDESQICWVGETTFEGNSADESGGALFFAGDSSVTSQGMTAFTKNRARVDGGAIASTADDLYTQNSGLFFNGSLSFMNNTCGGNGGAMAMYGDLGLEFRESSPQFLGNSAGAFGGAVFISGAAYGHCFDDVHFTENQAQNGGAVSALESGMATSTSSVGLPITYSTHFRNCTFVGNFAIAAGGAIESTVGHDHIENTAFLGNTANEGGALRLRGTVELFTSSFFDNKSGEDDGSAISNDGIISAMIGLNFSANLFQCPSTHFVNFSEGAGRFEAICKGCHVPCQDCIIEDNTSVPLCTTTFAHANSGGGAATIEGLTIDRGYWRATNRSTKVMSCHKADACLGGVTGNPGYCRDGYEGPYCSVCSEGYGATLAFTCSRCSDGNTAVVVVILVICLLAVLAVVSYLVSIEHGPATRGTVARLKTVLPLQSLKIIIVAWQIVTQFSSVANVIYPETYQRLLDFAALANLDLGRMLSAGCIMDADYHDGLLAATVGPLAAMALLGVSYTVAVRRNLGSEGGLHAVRRKHHNALIFVTFFVYSSVSSAVFRAFACDKLDDGNAYLRADYRIECDSPRHKAFQIYAGLMIVVYPVGIPLFYALILFHEHKTLVKGLGHEAQSRGESTSTLRRPYRPSVFYYEVVECSRRVLLTGAVVFIYPNTASQIAVTIVIAFTFVLVSEGLRPYVSRWDSWVSRAGHVIVFLSMYVALLLRVDVSSESQRDQNIFAGILVAAHAIMVLAVVVETMSLVYSLRTKETPLPAVRDRSVRSLHFPDDSSRPEHRPGAQGEVELVRAVGVTGKPIGN